MGFFFLRVLCLPCLAVESRASRGPGGGGGGAVGANLSGLRSPSHEESMWISFSRNIAAAAESEDRSSFIGS